MIAAWAVLGPEVLMWRGAGGPLAEWFGVRVAQGGCRAAPFMHPTQGHGLIPAPLPAGALCALLICV